MMKRMKGWRGCGEWRRERGKEKKGWGGENGHANYHISKLFFILPDIHLILLLILLSYSQQCERREKSISESMTWVMAKMNRMTKHQQASNRGVIDTFTQHKMDVVYSVSFHLERRKKAFWIPPLPPPATKKNVYIASNSSNQRLFWHEKFNRLLIEWRC